MGFFCAALIRCRLVVLNPLWWRLVVKKALSPLLNDLSTDDDRDRVVAGLVNGAVMDLVLDGGDGDDDEEDGDGDESCWIGLGGWGITPVSSSLTSISATEPCSSPSNGPRSNCDSDPWERRSRFNCFCLLISVCCCCCFCCCCCCSNSSCCSFARF